MKKQQFLIIPLLILLHLKSVGQDLMIYPLTLNDVKGHYGIGFIENSLLVTGEIKSKQLIQYHDESGNNSTAIYLVNDTSSNKKKLLEVFSQLNLNESCPNYSPERDMYTISRSIELTNHTRKSTVLGLFLYEKINGKYVESEFPHNSEDRSFQTGQGFYDSKSQRLYYVTNNPEGSGGSDIYFSEWKNNDWLSPICLNANVNSSKNELFPTINKDGDLIFASLRGINGDYDLFKAKWNGQNFEKAVAMDAPFNSPADDLQLIYTLSNEQGYLVSNRLDGIDRVFAFHVPRPEFKDCSPSEKPYFCYLFEETTIVPNDSLPMLYQWSFSDGTKSNGLKVEHCFKNLGDYKAVLNVYDSTTKVLYANLSELDILIHKSQLPYIKSNEKFYPDSVQLFESSASEIDDFKVEQIHWQFGDGGYERGSVVQHKFENPGTYNVDLLFIGTNSSGETQAKCATKEVIAISLDSILDLNQPIVLATQTLPAEEPISTKRDSVEYFVEITRSEVQLPENDPFFANIHYEITERISANDSLFHYTVGEEKDFISTLPILEDLRSNGYDSSIIKDVSQSDAKFSRAKNWWFIPDSIESAMNKQMNKFNDIKFETGSWTINKNSFDELAYIAKVIKTQPNVRLEIIAHTDSVGTIENNLLLSQRRAQSVAEKLTELGLDRTKMLTKGMGESISQKVDRKKNDLAEDRRVEFRIIRDL